MQYQTFVIRGRLVSMTGEEMSLLRSPEADTEDALGYE
jgi:hypothetical protein